MGNGMPGTVATGDMFSRFDELLNGEHRTQVVREMLNQEAIDQTLDGRGRFGSADHSHIDKHWLDPVSGWFRGGPSKQQRTDILRRGYIRAGKEALRKNLPVKTLWLCPGSEVWRTVVSSSNAQITLMIITPHSDEARQDEYEFDHDPDSDRLNVREEIWEIGLRDSHLNRAVVDIQTTGTSENASWRFTNGSFGDPDDHDFDLLTKDGEVRTSDPGTQPERMEVVSLRLRSTRHRN